MVRVALVQEEPRGFVSFVDERKKMRYASKTRPREKEDLPKPPAKKARFKGKPSCSQLMPAYMAPTGPVQLCLLNQDSAIFAWAVVTQGVPVGAGTESHMRAGELVHAGGSVRENGHNAELFSPPSDKSTFHGLGLAQALSDHLEGMIPLGHGTSSSITCPPVPLLEGRVCSADF